MVTRILFSVGLSADGTVRRSLAGGGSARGVDVYKRQVLPQCETARHRLFYGRMGTALHLIWPSLMRGLPAQMVLAHPPMSLQPPSRGPLASGRIQAAGYDRLPAVLFKVQ